MDKKSIIESLSEIEIKILPFLNLDIEQIREKSGLDKVSIVRAIQFLENKGLVKAKIKKTSIIDLGENGIVYKKNELPERRLLNLLAEKKELDLSDSKQTKLSENEFKAALGALKNKALIELKKGKIILICPSEEIAKKSLEEQLIEILPIEKEKLQPEQQHALNELKKRKDIIEIKEKKEIEVKITELGKEIMKSDVKSGDMIEALTPQIIKSGSWKKKKFRKYDIKSHVPKIYGGKKHFVSKGIEYARKIWTELGFQEMSGSLIQTGFWNFDALFTAQDHPVRELQDTFYIKDKKGKLPDKSLVKSIKKTHESGIGGSKGWQYEWQEDEAKKLVLRTHTTCLSAITLAKLKKQNIPSKFFAIGKCFRNETLDWSHGFEFNQTEGIVVDEKANFRHLLGYLKEFFQKMGYEKIRFVPAYFPYTEPSVEIHFWHPEKKVWLELGGAGIFRPEVTIPLLGRQIPVLAWGPGFDRIIMENYQIKDLREMYENNLTKLRRMKIWSR